MVRGGYDWPLHDHVRSTFPHTPHAHISGLVLELGRELCSRLTQAEIAALYKQHGCDGEAAAQDKIDELEALLPLHRQKKRQDDVEKSEAVIRDLQRALSLERARRETEMKVADDGPQNDRAESAPGTPRQVCEMSLLCRILIPTTTMVAGNKMGAGNT